MESMAALVVFAIYGGIILVGLVATIFWIIALVDCLSRQFADSTSKLIWVVVILFAHGLGALIYWFVGRPQALCA